MEQERHDPADRLVDCRGLRCPLPALVLAREVRARGAGGYRVQASDPAADKDIPALAAERGWKCNMLSSGHFYIVVGEDGLSGKGAAAGS